MEENDLDKGKISLFKYNESKDEWMEITTTYSGEDSTYYNYVARLTSFSYFALAEKTSAGLILTNQPSGTNVSPANISPPSTAPTNALPSASSDVNSAADSFKKTGKSNFFKDNSNVIIFSAVAAGLMVFILAIAVLLLKTIRRTEKDIGRFERMEKTAEKDLRKLEKVEKEAGRDLHKFERKFL